MQEHDLAWMRLALKEADRALEHEDVPVGCVIVSKDGELLASDHNRREQLQDPTAHAELLALRTAAQRIGHWRLEGATLYATLEPCCMCAGALVNARVARLVYAARDKKAGAVESLYALTTDLRLNHRLEVSGGVLGEEGGSRLTAFFAKLRAQGQK